MSVDNLQGMELTEFGGVLLTLWGEGEDAGGLDLDGEDLGGGEEHAEQAASGEEHAAGEHEPETKVDGRKGSKEFRDALKLWEATPEGAKHAKTAREDRFRMDELSRLEPGGITGVREKYALLESIGGPDAVTQLQDTVAEREATDAFLMSGDPKALESMGPDFDPGLAKLTPAILERVMKNSPEAYAAAILPHLMSGLAGSPMVTDLNRMVDVLQSTHLDEATKLKQVTGLLSRIGGWFEANEKKAGELKTAPVDKGRSELDQERGKFEQEQQTAHWKNNIQPAVAAYEKGKLEELFKPYDTRLKLDPAAKADLFETFRAKMTAAGKADTAFGKQMALYRKQKNPDPAVVQNFVKAAINRHAKTVVEGAVKARYGRFLGAAKPKPVAAQAGARTGAPTVGAAPTIVSVRPTPDEIDYRKTSEEDQWNRIYTLKTGKRVQVKKAN